MNILNDVPSEAFEDIFFSELAKYDKFTDEEIKTCCNIAHKSCGGDIGDESYEYCFMLVKEANGEIKKDGLEYLWIK